LKTSIHKCIRFLPTIILKKLHANSLNFVVVVVVVVVVAAAVMVVGVKSDGWEGR
jgi:hypothetical protein